MQQLLDEAERLLAVTSVELARAPLSAEVRSRLGASLDADRPADRQVQPMPLAVRRNPDGGLIWSGSDVVFGEVIRTNPHVRLMDESMVVRVLEEDGSVRGVVVRDQTTGEHHTVRSDFVVVAADSLRTPQLLFASGIRLPALGRFLNDQPQVVHAVRLRNVGDAGNASAKDVEITEQSGVAWVPFTDDEPFHGQVMQLDASPVPLEGDVVPGSVVGLGWFCAKDLQETDRLEFDAEEVDDYGMPAMRIHYTLTQRDRATIDRAKRAIVRVGDSLGESLGEPIEFPPGASLHYQGTVRMGPIDDGTSVCDKNSQVWGIKGLHVAGNGVIPTATACNPTLTNVALAVRGATSIANQLHAEVEKEEIHA
jgi:choline dehydrogenase-like flavoprotein